MEANVNEEIRAGGRFQFGANWVRFLSVLDDDRISEAESSLKQMLSVDSLAGLRFLDAGCGSGLSSLAAKRLGATVYSFDFDPQSVACTHEIKRRYFENDKLWTIEEGSVLDLSYLKSLGQFDVVYSWGVLHHTGAMWLGIERAISCVTRGGKLFISIYNDQGWKSHSWWFVKFIYNKLPRLIRPLYVYLMWIITTVLVILKYTFKLKPMTAIRPLLYDEQGRGMSAKYDLVDWIGGFPYEFAEFDVLVAYLNARGFTLINANRNTSLGCSEMVFTSIT
jgi:2-polyprenyl-3-methyl-5-hydroxy-6-metoxy-1,4-benzoquinol methylase